MPNVPQDNAEFLLGELAAPWSRGLVAAQYLTFSFAQTETLHRNTNVHVLCIHNDREVLRHNGSQARQWLRQDMKC